MRYKPFFSTPFVASLTIGFIFFALLTLLFELPNRQIIQKKAANAQDVYIYFIPSDTKINTNQVTVSMYAKFTAGTASEKIDYFKTRVVLPSAGQFLIPVNSYVTTTFPSNGVNFDRIFHVDGPNISNTNKAIVVELGSQIKGGGPSTDPTLNGGAGLKVAEFQVQRNPAVAWTAGQALGFKIDNAVSQVVVAPLSEVIPLTSSSTLENGPITYDPAYGVPTPTPIPPTPTPLNYCTGEGSTCTWCPACLSATPPCKSPCLVGGICLNQICVIPSPTVTITPTLTPTPVPPTNTPVPTSTPTPTRTPTPTPIPTWTPTPSATPIPTATRIPPTLTTAPTIIACARKAYGDANCDGVIDGVDYSIWLNSQCHPQPGTSAFCDPVSIDHDADFDHDGNRDDTDYRIWFDHRWL